jgi:hypothetical protein
MANVETQIARARNDWNADRRETQAFEQGLVLGTEYAHSRQKCSGYKNYATFAVALWIDSGGGEQLQSYWHSVARDAKHMAEANGDTPESWLAERMKDELTDPCPVASDLAKAIDGAGHPFHTDAMLGGLYSDLLSAALSEVNWYEIAQHLLEE